ncbi:hypothetical protein [Fibrella forsythiae]|uniref:Uncharacterized protein n=1 Tax=Fibrella forsythiae TaxID=2817061 RepID=A0ABS3JQ08_9BACT|nr:hypothetical protein [Fibrella forsythiae]MBO0951017.1 hypothetical protein [Fibrella forsythiae]
MPKLFPYHRFHNFLPEGLHKELYDYVIANELRFEVSKVNHGKEVDKSAKQSTSLFSMGKFADVFKEALTTN